MRKYGTLFLAAAAAYVILDGRLSDYSLWSMLPLLGCTVAAWAGDIPPGFLPALLVESERRGRDSTGIAYRPVGERRTYMWVQAVPAHRFVSLRRNRSFLADAEAAPVGIAHCRRASPGMPVNNKNAHPFLFGSMFFAHNGVVRNWKDLKAHVKELPNMTDVEKSWIASAATDSMVLGPMIRHRDFSKVIGCMGLVWIERGTVSVMRAAKELVAAHVLWVNQAGEDKYFTVVASTKEIIADAFAHTKKLVSYDYEWAGDLDEGVVYEVRPNKLVESAKVPIGKAQADKFTSQPVMDKVALAAAELDAKIANNEEVAVDQAD